MRSRIATSLLVVLLMAGSAIAGHRTRTHDITATFDVERISHTTPKTCAGADGGAYVERTDKYEGEMYSEDPRLAGDLQIEAHTLVDTNTGDGITVSKLRLFDPTTGREKFNGGYSAALDRFDEGMMPPVLSDPNNFAEGFWFSKVKGVGGEGDDNEGPHPQGLLAANFHVNISESKLPNEAGMIEPGDEGPQHEVGDGQDSGELGQETQAEEWDDENEDGEEDDNDEDNPAVVQTGSCTDFSDWDNDWVG